jgi:hypothetical protein
MTMDEDLKMFQFDSETDLIYIAATNVEEAHDLFEQEIDKPDYTFRVREIEEQQLYCDFHGFSEILPNSYYFVEARGAFYKMTKPGVITSFQP